MFGLGAERLYEIFDAVAFPCHCTIDYGASDRDSEYASPETKYKNDNPQQCAGLMSLLHRSKHDNQIMQVGFRMGAFDPKKLDHSDIYASIEDCVAAHTGKIGKKARSPEARIRRAKRKKEWRLRVRGQDGVVKTQLKPQNMK